MFETLLTPDSPFEGTLDVEAIIRTIPKTYTVKGMFCTRFLEMLGPDSSAVRSRLDAPPASGRYVAFKDYSQADYTRLVVAAASKRFPHTPMREGLRCIAREDLATFAHSVIGRVVLALGVDVRRTLHHLPDVYARVAPGPIIRTEDLNPHTTRITFEGHHGVIEYTIGQLEGIVMSFGLQPSLIVHRVSANVLAFDLTHGA